MGKVCMNLTNNVENIEVTDPEIKRVTLHPLTADGEVDLDINLYPKTLVDGVVDREGKEVDIATQAELDEVAAEAEHQEALIREEVAAVAASKQDTLVSGENIKTINGESILGSGDIKVVADYCFSEYDTLDHVYEVSGEKTFFYTASDDGRNIGNIVLTGKGEFGNLYTVYLSSSSLGIKEINEASGNNDLSSLHYDFGDWVQYITSETIGDYTDPIKNEVGTLSGEVSELDKRVDTLDDQILVYDYFYGVSHQEVIPDGSDSDSEDEIITTSEVVFPIYKTKYNLLELSSKGRSDTLTDYFVELSEPTLLSTSTKILTNTTPITLYQTGLSTDMAFASYGYDTFNVLEKKVYRYCLPITFRELFTAIPASLPKAEIDYEESSNGRLVIAHSTLESRAGIKTDKNAHPKYTRDIGLTYAGIGTAKFAISNLKALAEQLHITINNKSDAINMLCADEFADIKVIFKSAVVEVEDRSDIEVNISAIPCDGEFAVGVSNFAGCIKASYVSLKALVYTKDQCDAKFQTIAEYVDQYTGNDHIVKIGDLEDDNKLEATNTIYSTVLKNADYPKIACAVCIEPAQGEEPVTDVGFRGYTLFISQGDNITVNYYYLAICNGKTYKITRVKQPDNTYKDSVEQVSIDKDNAVLSGPLAFEISQFWPSMGDTIIKSATSDGIKTVLALSSDGDLSGESFDLHNIAHVYGLAEPVESNEAISKQYFEDNAVLPEDLAVVATTGSYNDLVDKPESNIRNGSAAGSLFQVAQVKEGLTWSSEDDSIATVDENGHVEAISAGTTTISVIDEDGRTAECTVNVSAPAGRSLRKGALRSAENEEWEKVTSLSDLTIGSTIVLVYEQGKMELTSITSSGTKYGVGTEYASSPAGTFRLTVEAGSTSDTFAFKNGDNYLTWTSGNTLNVASSKSDNTSWSLTFSSDKITEISCSKLDSDKVRQLWWNNNSSGLRFACYTGKTDGSSNYYAPQIYKLVVPVESITINNNPETLTIGSTYQLTTTILPDDASDKSLTWHTSNDTIISVSSTGLLTAEGLGTATIYASANDGSQVESDPISITVQEAAVVTAISVSASPSSGVAGNTLALTANVTGSGPSYNTVNWSIDDTDVATITSTGANTANAVLTRVPGTATVTATSAVAGFESISGSTTITNNQIWVSNITIDPATETNLTVGLTYPTGCTVEPSDATNPNVIWSTSDPTVATISDEIISALGAGTAIIKATAADGHTPIVEDSITVTVHEPLGSLYLDQEELNLTVGESYDLLCSDHPINKANGVLSTALGSGSITTEDNQVVVGTYNEETDSLFVVGNGGSEATRANAFEVTPEGKAIVGANTENNDSANTLVTKGFAESTFLAKTRTVNILTSDWVDSAVELNLSPVSVSSADVLFVSPTDDCAQEYYNCGIQRAVNGSTLTLTAATIPQNTITIQIIYFKGQAF